MAGDDHAHHPSDAIKAGLQASAVVGTTGFFISAIQNALHKNNVGALAVFTRSGGNIAVFAIAGGAYGFSRAAAGNLRQKDDAINTAIGGFLAGSILGMTRKRLPAVLGIGSLAAVTLGVFDVTGSRLRGWQDRPEEDEFERKLRLRANRRRPIEETIAEIGEGRGIKPEGYEERRRQRLFEKYGVEINPVSATSS
ncbi:NADH-ubiquinone oxidoreductase 21.3 kDa subunit [Plectosphaerella plurivora]|uniref:NADH-ubiquinone oxidoreductase 21.3 kDa subunit n=1 Tax=Plectosphaerella plurivora TaxID=936078 RepID=A0A9P8VC63_9PEZI|nr:NADH-ubiquinone oxidoreductase 21.3 kDa subunit [Plectosphaerella plurivora]